MGATSVVTIPLKTQEWESNELEKRLEICRQIYNAMLDYELKELHEMERRPEYKQAQEIIANAYKTMKPAERAQDNDFNMAWQTINKLKGKDEYNFSLLGFKHDVGKFYKHFGISCDMARLSVAEPMWSAFDKYFKGKGKIKHKCVGDLRSIATNGESGIRIVDENNNTVLGKADGRKLYCVCGLKKQKIVKMPLKVDEKDYYKLEMLDKESYKIVRIIKKEVREKLEWYVQITVSGAPVTRYDKDGNEKNPINEGKVGMYIDTSHVVYTTDGETFTDISLEDTDTDIYYDTKMKELQQYLDNSKRATNPENFNEDGTIKKGIYVEGKRHKLKWTYSNGHKKAVAKLRDLHRVRAENRKLERIKIANEILSHGNRVAVNDYPFQKVAMRKKETENENDKKKQGGYSIGHNAPAMLVSLIDMRLKTAGYNGVKKKKLKNIEKSEGYRERYAREMYLALI